MEKGFHINFQTSLRFRLYVFFSGGVFALSLFIYLYFPEKYYEQRLSSVTKKTFAIAEVSAVSASSLLNSNDSNGFARIFEPIKHVPEIRYIVIRNAEQRLVAAYQIDSAVTCKYLDATEKGTVSDNYSTLMVKVPIESDGTTLGFIYVGYSLDPLFTEVKETKNNIALISLMVFAAGIFLVYILSVILTKPIDKMVSTVQQISQRNYTLYMKPTGYYEIDRLGRAFNTMVDELASAQTEIQSVNRTLEERVNERTRDLQDEILHRKKTESALRESEERYKALVELSPDAIIVFSDGIFYYINPAAVKVFHAEAQETIHNSALYEFMIPERAKQFKEMIEQVSAGSVLNVQTDFIFHRHDIGEFIANITITRLVYREKNSVQIVIRDISAWVKNERQRLELEQQILHIQKKEIISTLASGIAHDILNILGIIGTAINKLLFLKNIDEKSLMESAEQISKATDRGKALVKQLLTFAKKTELNFDVTQVNVPVSEIVNVIQQTFPASIVINAHLAEQLPLIRADNNQLHQALLNLCLNARDAIQGKGTIVIETTSTKRISFGGNGEKQGEYICISVSDDGVGMEPEVLKRIYEPFFSTKSEGTGSGLGLAMVKGIVENHRGFIEVESETGKGSTFRLYFPV